MRTPIKVGWVAGLALATCLVTSEIMNRYVRARPDERTVASKAGKPGIPAAPNPQVVGPEDLGGSQLVGYEVKAEGHDVRVAATVELTDRRKGVIYVWRLRVDGGDHDKGVGLDKPYEDQVFEIDPSGRMIPTFAERLRLPAGRHRVMVTLYAVPKGYDLAQLNDAKKARGSRVIHAVEWIEIK